MTLPRSICAFANVTIIDTLRTALFYEVIMSRPARAVQVGPGIVGLWSQVPPMRCMLTRQSLADRYQEGFLICVLREFNQVPG